MEMIDTDGTCFPKRNMCHPLICGECFVLINGVEFDFDDGSFSRTISSCLSVAVGANYLAWHLREFKHESEIDWK